MRWIHAHGLLALVLLGAVLPAQVPSRSSVSGEVAFDGEATMGDFTGRSTAVVGALSGADSLPAVRGWVEFPVRSLATGNGRRDKDMYKSLEADDFPVIRFELDAVAPGAPSGDSLAVTLRGRFTIKGESREHAVPGWVWLDQNGATRFRGTLPMNLHDYEIGGLSKMLGLLKMHPDIVVRVDLTFR